MLARDLGDCRDNLRNSRSVFLIVIMYLQKTVRNRICRYVYLLFIKILIGLRLLRQIHMNFLNTVFIQRFDNQTDTVFRCNRIAEFREPIQMLDDKSTEGIIIFRFQIQFQTVIEVVQIDRTFDQIFFVRNFVNKIFFILSYSS